MTEIRYYFNDGLWEPHFICDRCGKCIRDNPFHKPVAVHGMTDEDFRNPEGVVMQVYCGPCGDTVLDPPGAMIGKGWNHLFKAMLQAMYNAGMSIGDFKLQSMMHHEGWFEGGRVTVPINEVAERNFEKYQRRFR